MLLSSLCLKYTLTPPLYEQFQINFYIIIFFHSPKRSAEDLRESSVIHKPIYNESSFSTYTSSDGEQFIYTRHSTETLHYDISTIAIAMFLILSFAGPDLRAALALWKAGTIYHKVLGFVILSSFGMLVLSSLRILFYLSNDSASFIVGAAAVLFISDLVSNGARIGV